MDSHRDQSKASISVVVPHSPTVQTMLVTILFERKIHNMACVRTYAGTSIWIIIHTITDIQLLDRFLQDFYLNANFRIHSHKISCRSPSDIIKCLLHWKNLNIRKKCVFHICVYIILLCKVNADIHIHQAATHSADKLNMKTFYTSQ